MAGISWLGWIIGGFCFGLGFSAGNAVFHAIVDLVQQGKGKGHGV